MCRKKQSQIMQLSFLKGGVRKGILIISCSRLLKILPLLPMGHLSVERWYTPKPTSHFSDIQFGQLTFLSQWHVSRSDVCHFQQKVFRILMEHTAMWPFFFFFFFWDNSCGDEQMPLMSCVVLLILRNCYEYWNVAEMIRLAISISLASYSYPSHF